MATQNPQDRRQSRSHERTLAIHYLLQQVAEEYALEAFAVADLTESEQRDMPTGRRQKGRSQLEPEITDLVNQRRFEQERALAEAHTDIAKVTAQDFFAGGEHLLLTVVGAPGMMREVGMVRAIMGIRRIWRETSEATHAA